MAVPAAFDEDSFVEERIARLEEETNHIQSDITEMNADVRRTEDKVDSYAATAKISVGRMQDRVSWLLIAGATLGVPARGFKWI